MFDLPSHFKTLPFSVSFQCAGEHCEKANA